MAVTRQQYVPLSSWVSGASITSASAFTPTAANLLVVFASFFDQVGGSTAMSASGTGTYSVLNPPGQHADTQSGRELTAVNVSATGGSQTATVTLVGGGPGGGGFSVSEYSGANTASLAGALVERDTPGTGAGAILGTAVVVPVGGVLTAWCQDISNGTGPITNTTDGSTVVAGSGTGWCVIEYAGAGASITPKFTSSVGAATDFTISQVMIPPAAVSGSGATAEAHDVSSAAGAETDTGSGSTAEAHDTSSGSGSQADSGSGATLEGADASSGTGGQTDSGSGATLESADTSTATGAQTDAGSGATLEAHDTSSGSGAAGGGGSGATVEGPDQSAGSGSQTDTGSVAAVEGSDISTGAGAQAQSGSGADLEAHDISSGSGASGTTGSGADVEGHDVSAGSGAQVDAGSGATPEGVDISAGAGGERNAGSGATHEGADVSAGSGGESFSGTIIIIGEVFIASRPSPFAARARSDPFSAHDRSGFGVTRH